MIKSFKMFAGCVESMRTAEEEYKRNPTDANRSIVESLQNKCDAWLQWIRDRQDEQLERDLPTFVGKVKGDGTTELPAAMMKQLMANHTPEEIERYQKMMKEYSNK